MSTKATAEFFSKLEALLANAPTLEKVEGAHAAILDGALNFLAPLQADKLTTSLENKENDLGLVGVSESMASLRAQILKVAGSSASVLISGESGTGKEGVAQALVANSPRKNAPFLKINCGALAEGVLESELFGHVRGAFTGAANAHEGVFARAHGGTIFLDEVGETPLSTQVKLLRVLQEGTFTPVGGNVETRVDVRIIAATNRDLSVLRKKGTFRDDFFFRLAVVCLEVPPLRSRKEDIPALVQCFLNRERSRDGHGVAHTVTAELLEHFAAHSWPGNVRELENSVRRLVALSGGNTILHSGLQEQEISLGLGKNIHRDLTRGIHALVSDLEREIVKEALELCRTMSRAAVLLKMTQPGLRAKMDRLGVPVPAPQVGGR
ncbi:MAG: sigma-54-dependent Fis family transcriptional regulator [Silvanigrellales bacterium]|jgi:DNA-binding NtrC family response regulator|nr:sigma-54-dependent Fis family transcriptional regulator [Silvanigrellales bacterium]